MPRGQHFMLRATKGHHAVGNFAVRHGKLISAHSGDVVIGGNGDRVCFGASPSVGVPASCPSPSSASSMFGGKLKSSQQRSECADGTRNQK
jgi:hypothetical protein